MGVRRTTICTYSITNQKCTIYLRVGPEQVRHEPRVGRFPEAVHLLDVLQRHVVVRGEPPVDDEHLFHCSFGVYCWDPLGWSVGVMVAVARSGGGLGGISRGHTAG